MDMTSLDMDEPIPLVEMKDGKLQLNPEAVLLLSNNRAPATVISIVGKGRTGKSYFMNRLFNSNSGFELGNTIKPQTKGIWMWVKPHPVRKNTALILLDIEGLSACDQDDENLDMNLFCLALLTSKVMIYNVQNVLDSAILHEINFMSELTNYIKLKEKSEDEEKNGFASYFPHLCFLIRDFDKELKNEEKKITPNEYLEDVLKEKQNKTNKKPINAYNLVRKCIKEFFQKRDCFTLCKPVDDEELLHRIHTLQDDEIKEKFITSVNVATLTILKFAEPQYIGDDEITLRRFIELLDTYVKCMNRGLVPCFQTSTDQVKEIEFKHACIESENTYNQKMTEYLQRHEPYPVTAEQLQEFHESVYDSAVKTYTQLVFASDKEDGDRKQELLLKLKEIHKHFEEENNIKSAKLCKTLIENNFEERMQKLKAKEYFCEGGHDMYLQDTKQAEEGYHAALHKGPRAEEMLSIFQEQHQDEYNIIINIEQEMRLSNEKTIALENKQKETKQKQKELEIQLRNKEIKGEELIRLNEELLQNNQAREQTENNLRKQKQIDNEQIKEFEAKFSKRETIVYYLKAGGFAVGAAAVGAGYMVMKIKGH